MYKDVFNKQSLIANYELLLQQGLYKGMRAEQILTKARLDKSIIIQKTSGSVDHPIIIPRSTSDVSNTFLRVIAPHAKHYRAYPKRVAIIGGISHAEAALKLDIEAVDIENFTPTDLSQIAAYSPEMVFCYPSIMREILARKILLPELLTIKLGGEIIFNADLENIFTRYPDCLVIEQFGSTEMPAIALRVVTKDHRDNPYQLQTSRFDFLNLSGEGWKPVIVKDKFAELILPIGQYYDTGDEMLLAESNIIAVRRRNDQAVEYYPLIEQLLAAGCENVQLDLHHHIINYSGEKDVAKKINYLTQEFVAKKNQLKRIDGSNKLPLVLNSKITRSH